MGLLKRIWNWIFPKNIFVKKTYRLGNVSVTEETLPIKPKLRPIKTVSKRITYRLVCSKCGKKSNTSNIKTAKRKKYLCRECWKKSSRRIK